MLLKKETGPAALDTTNTHQQPVDLFTDNQAGSTRRLLDLSGGDSSVGSTGALGVVRQAAPVASPASTSASTLNLQEQLRSPDSLISRAIGYSEGNRTLSGGKTNSYHGHRDPGNGVRNQGTFSYQHGAPTPEEADRRWLTELRNQLPRYEQAAQQAGLDPKNPLLAASFFDLYTQSPLAAGSFLERFDELASKGVTPDNIAEQRVKSYYYRGRLDAPGFGNSLSRLTADQQRRVNALNAVVEREGLSGTTGPVASRPSTGSSTAPSLEDVAAGRAALREGMRGDSVKALQEKLVSTGHLTQAQMATGPGIFGPATGAAVESFQRSKGLAVDGVVGKDTWAALSAATRPSEPQPGGSTQAPSIEDVAAGKEQLRPGMQGESVRLLQQELVRTGHLSQAQMNTGPGVYGPATEAAVAAFQREKHLLPSGGYGSAVGKSTWEALRSAPAASQPRPGTGGVPTEPNTMPPSPALEQVRSGQAVLSPGSSGEAVAALQDQLVRAGFMSRDVVNGGRGTFGPNTENGVRIFQVRNGLQPTGQVDQRTLQAIESSPTFSTAGNRTATGYQAGQPFPLTLTPIGTEVEGAGTRTAYLRTDAARSFLELKQDIKRDLGVDIGINDSFRSNELQAERRRQYGGAAARPGYSNHQQGLSLDLDVRNPRVEQWLLSNAHKYGFIRGDSVPDDLVRRLGLAAEGHHYTYQPQYADDPAPRYIQR